LENVKEAFLLSKVKQVIETNDLNATNELIKSKNWILLNSYCNRAYGNKPTYCLGRIESFKKDEKLCKQE